MDQPEAPVKRSYRYLLVHGVDDDGGFRLVIDFQLLGSMVMERSDQTERFMGAFNRFQKIDDDYQIGTDGCYYHRTKVSTTLGVQELYLDHENVRTYS